MKTIDDLIRKADAVAEELSGRLQALEQGLDEQGRRVRPSDRDYERERVIAEAERRIGAIEQQLASLLDSAPDEAEAVLRRLALTGVDALDYRQRIERAIERAGGDSPRAFRSELRQAVNDRDARRAAWLIRECGVYLTRDRAEAFAREALEALETLLPPSDAECIQLYRVLRFEGRLALESRLLFARGAVRRAKGEAPRPLSVREMV
ncbi:hypothetical protein NET02_12695 [Thermomicrobiaceae bacterium CFH 74404]|uniref:Uncharacterized protein n=1 Tax=Thermalbibacter longus TaxID=2951981 RepID=A0AA41WFA2_9BACT|nr:hypothetical protein [Thermalbibacter longus]MCM8750008.1 hypothetical protein [Thermalbibacter longus]